MGDGASRCLSEDKSHILCLLLQIVQWGINHGLEVSRITACCGGYAQIGLQQSDQGEAQGNTGARKRFVGIFGMPFSHSYTKKWPLAPVKYNYFATNTVAIYISSIGNRSELLCG